MPMRRILDYAAIDSQRSAMIISVRATTDRHSRSELSELYRRPKRTLIPSVSFPSPALLNSRRNLEDLARVTIGLWRSSVYRD